MASIGNIRLNIERVRSPSESGSNFPFVDSAFPPFEGVNR